MTLRDTTMRERVLAALDMIRPVLRADGGDVELVEVTDTGVVKVRLRGACQRCTMSRMTLKNGIERTILKEIPGLTSVESV